MDRAFERETMTQEWVPTEVVLHAASGRLELAYVNGRRAEFTAPSLREACKCATCENRRLAGQPPVALVGTAFTHVNPIGELGLQFVFSDGHDRGIFPWPYLHQLSLELPA
jgi:DUF971 family protein